MRAVLAWSGIGLLLRLGRAPARWDEIALAYAAYTEPVARALGTGELSRALATWVGLHPPLYAAALAALDAVSPRPALWLGLSALASALAVLVVGQAGGAVAAAVLATAPLQLAYAAEVNNYPLAVLAVALCLRSAAGPWPWLAACVVLAGWSHVLAGLSGLAILVWRLSQRDLGRGDAARLLLAVGLGLAPVGAGALRRLTWESTWGQAGGDALAWAVEAARRVGPEGLLIGLLALPSLRGPALAAALSLGLALAASVLLGAAAPHQFPYLLLFGPAVALAAGRAAARPWVRVALLALCGLRGARMALDESRALGALWADQAQARGIDALLAASAPGDLLWLVAPALRPDDDKTDTSPVLWRLSPWEPWARAETPGWEYTDPRAGQPRAWRGRVVATSTALDPAAFDAAAGAALRGGHRAWVLLYEHGPAEGLRADVERVLRPYRGEAAELGGDPELGPDVLYRVEGLR